MDNIRHGNDGWELISYEWKGAHADFRYERTVEQINGERKLEVYEVTRPA